MYSINVKQVFDPNMWVKELNKFQYSIFITNNWLSAIAGSNETSIYFDFKKGERTVAKIGGLSIENRKNKPNILYFYSGIAFKSFNEKLIHSCYNQLIIFAKTHGYDKVIIKSYDYQEKFSSPITNLIVERIRWEYLVDLTLDENAIFSRFSKTMRRKIRNAGKYDSIIQESKSFEILKLLMEYLDITREIRISKGYSYYNIFPFRNFDEHSLQYFLKNGSATMFYVKTNNEIISIHFVLLSGQRSHLLLIGTTEKGYNLYAPVFLEFHSMLLLKNKGYSVYNLGGIPYHPSHKGLIQYKKSLGAYKQTLMDQETLFLQFPLKILNPLLLIIDHLPDNRLSKLFKKALRKVIKLFIIDDD